MIHINKEDIGNRIREARENVTPTIEEINMRQLRKNKRKAEKGITKEELLARIKAQSQKNAVGDRKSIKGDRKSVYQWEYGQVLPSTENLIAICNALDIGIGYLFGEYTEKNYSLHYICRETGLSEKAVSKLQSLSSDDVGICYYISAIVEHNLFEDLIKAIGLLIETSDKIRECPNHLIDSITAERAAAVVDIKNIWQIIDDYGFTKKGADIYRLRRQNENYTLPSKK